MWFYNLVSSIPKPLQKTLEYQPEFNPRVHGPYNPAQYYGKADPLGEVKVGEVGKWFGRRNFGWAPFTRLVSRAMWRYRMKYVVPKHTSLAPVYHMAAFLFLTSYILSEHHERKHHKWAIYH